MHFVIERHLDAPPTHVWPLVADPVRMSEWSLAPVRSLAPGDRGHAGTTGALRVVIATLRLGPRRVTTKLVEVIERGEPPHRVHYRLIGGFPLESHRGEVELSPSSRGGTDLRWTVTAHVGAGLDRMLGKRIHADLARSLDRLPARLRPSPARVVELPKLAAVEEASPALWAAADELLAMQRERAETLATEGEPRMWFARIYSVVTEELLAQARSGEIVHPAWLLRLIPIFERYYADNLAAFRAGRAGDLEAHWARAFRAAGRGPETKAIAAGLFHGIRAHVEGDLGRSLGEVHARFYADKVDYARFRADYMAMNSIFRAAAETMFTEVPTRAMPLWFRLARKTLPLGLLDLVRDRTFYDMPRQRRRAFDDGARVSRLLADQISARENDSASR